MTDLMAVVVGMIFFCALLMFLMALMATEYSDGFDFLNIMVGSESLSGSACSL